MTGIFKIIELPEQQEGGKNGIRIEIGVSIEGHESLFPVSRVCHSYEDLNVEVEAIKNNLEQIKEKTRHHFRKSSSSEFPEVSPEMSAEEIWSLLCEIEREDFFVKSFNNLDEVKRREVSEHVLTKCNVFSGKASIFSGRYNNASGSME